MDKWSDELVCSPSGTYRPTAVIGLLRTLHLEDAPEDEQRSGIAAWLRDNVPTPTLEHNLRRRGYGTLLNGQATA